ncbi:MAG: MotA/TolQ/ExbB proton channel family protein [Bdellovibrionales bacterium]
MEPVSVEQVHWLIKAFNDGGTAMYFIALTGLLTVFLIIERFIALHRLIVDKDDFVSKVFPQILNGNIREAIMICEDKNAPLPNTVKEGLKQVLNRRPDEEVQVALDGAVLEETPRLEGLTPMLAVSGNVATLIGLLGTVIGLIIGFSAVSQADAAQKAELLSQGISHALNCTAAGLAVAIPALLAYGFYQLRIGKAINDMQETSMKIMNLVVSNRDKLKS